MVQKCWTKNDRDRGEKTSSDPNTSLNGITDEAGYTTCSSSRRVGVHLADVLSRLVSQRMNVETETLKVRPLGHMTQSQLVLGVISAAR